jgi:hypothetical protein
LYADNAEPERAALCYQWAGATEKLIQLANDVGDRLLPLAPVGAGPWWQQVTSLAAVAAQHDLLDDATAGRILKALLDFIPRIRPGELIDNPGRALTVKAIRAACALAGRGTVQDAQALLRLFVHDVVRNKNTYQLHDEKHVKACLAIAARHTELAWPALVRLFDLAEVGVHEADEALHDRFVVDQLRDPSETSRLGSAPLLG